MELLAGAAFAEGVDPFPEPSPALICHQGSNPATGVRYPGEGVHYGRPKLKPIRCAFRSPLEAPDGGEGLRVRAGDDGSEGPSGAGVADAAEGCGLGSDLREGSGDPGSAKRFWEESWGSSSDKGDDASSDVRELDNRRRKRTTGKKLELFMKDMVMKLMARQEQMHQELVQMLEMKERERISREEAWRRLVMEQIKRNEELRAQDTSRSLALISFIEKLTGHQVPQQLNSLSVEEEEDENQGSKDVEFDPPNSAKKCNPNQKQNNGRWPASEVQALIALRASLQPKLHTGFKRSIWEEISQSMSAMGYKRSTNKCREKWDNINKYFKKSIEKGKKRPAYSKSCPYFHELDVLYKTGVIDSTNALDSSGHKQELEPCTV
ncbi:trihelix transcription factor GTL1 [Rhodamnia argentea]|uniref:Trihelix transcription factor GTL1 n=1 Tax=Rhodamnia argentea TaxID=178133 RepID=A0A8B8PFX7_9MYRT|nr:trihelix transcription factor GTL1 [Rhodamnia argentea]